MNYQVIQYFDVNKNDDDIWYVEKSVKSGIHITLDDPKSAEAHKGLFKLLKDLGVLETSDARKISVSVGQDIIEVFEKKTEKPLCRLEKRDRRRYEKIPYYF